MMKIRRAQTRTAATDLIWEIFRLQGALATDADTLVADIGITIARWQVLDAIAASLSAEPVARLARTLGLSRQNVQRIVNELATDRLVRLDDNPHHKRAKLVVLTPRGRKAWEDADKRQAPWANILMTGLTQDQIANALHVLRTLRARVEAG